jgi:hypothetical protein
MPWEFTKTNMEKVLPFPFSGMRFVVGGLLNHLARFGLV